MSINQYVKLEESAHLFGKKVRYFELVHYLEVLGYLDKDGSPEDEYLFDRTFDYDGFEFRELFIRKSRIPSIREEISNYQIEEEENANN